MSRYVAALLALATVASSGCADEVDPFTPVPSASLSSNGIGRLPVYNHGLDRAVPNHPCKTDTHYRDFDFWLGEWDVGLSGGSRIESLLDGCVVQESYLPNVGTVGESLNSYDADIGAWRETWIGQNPRGQLRMSGNRAGDVLSMSGVKPSAIGDFIDSYSWTRVSDDVVIQAFESNYPVPPFTGGSSITYHRTTGLTDGPGAPSPACRNGPGANNRVLDFMHGDWTVERERGQVIGTASIVPEISGCVTVMRMTTTKGYEAIAYTYFDATEFRFFRTYVDSEGERVELRGFIQNGALVLEGVEHDDDGVPMRVRVTIRDDTPDLTSELWEVAPLGSTEWTEDMTISFRRR